MSVGHTEPPGSVWAKIFYQIDSVCSTFLCVRFHFTMSHHRIFSTFPRKHLTGTSTSVIMKDNTFYAVVCVFLYWRELP